MVKGMKRRSKENSEFKDKSGQMSESELKLMVEDLIKLISDNPKHKLFLNILNLFKNKEYSSLDFNEIYDYLLIDTKLNPLKYSSQDANEETKPQLKSKLDFIMNKNCSFKVTNRGRKKIIELNLLKTKEYLDKIINGEELLCNENELEEKKENNENSEKLDKTEEEKIKEKKEEKEISLKEEEEKKEDKDEPIKKHRGRKRKIKNENRENLNLVINLNQKKEDSEKKRRTREKKEEKEIKLGKKQEREKERDKEKDKDKDKEKNVRKNSRKKKEEDKTEKIDKKEKIEKKEKTEKVEKIEKVERKEKIDKMETENNENFSIMQKKDDNIQANNLFLKPLYRELFETNSNQIKESIPNEIEASLKQISNVKNDLGNLEDKMKLFNNKIIDLNINKQKYDDFKTKVKETQDELYNLYFIMINEVNSLNILLKMKNYNKEIYNIHNEALEKHKNEYTNVTEKMKLYLINIKSLETEIITSKKEIKQLLNGIISLFKNMLGIINTHSSNYEKMELLELKYNEIEANENFIDVNHIIREFIGKKDEVLKKINGYNKYKEKKEEIKNDIIMQNAEKKNVINEEDIQKVYEEMARENEENNKKESEDVIISQQDRNANMEDNNSQNKIENNN